MKYYAVRYGRQTGVYLSWEACRAQVEGYTGAQYKSFATREEAESYIYASQSPAKTHSSSMTDPVNLSTDIQIWVDGACIEQSDGQLRIGWAYVIRADGKEIRRDSGNDIPAEFRPQRNVAGEIMAVLKAVEWCQERSIPAITIHHDYQGLASWVTGTWKAKNAFTQAYSERVRTSGVAIQWSKVKAHSGEPMNDLVDRLAREAALQNESA